jgi:predicted DNA-binding antitoxin AbrB/MazE fold protein
MISSGHWFVSSPRGCVMVIMIEAVYEDGVLKPTQPLPLQEHERVHIQVQTVPEAVRRVRQSAGLIPCADQTLIEWAAKDPELDYP